MADLNHKSRDRRLNRVERFGRFASRARRLAFESLEQRGMLAALIGATPADCEMPIPADAEPPVEESVIALPEGWSLTLVNPWETAGCWILPPGDDVAQPTIDLPSEEILAEGSIEGEEALDPDFVQPDGWIRCGTDLVMNGLGNYLVEQYREFVGLNPTWPEEHGAGGIQLMVITPSQHVRWAELSTPGEARSFDAWYEQTYLGIDPIDSLPPSDDAPVTVDDRNLYGPELPVPVASPTDGSDGTPKSAASVASVADAAWASFFTGQGGSESAGTTPVGGRRRGR
jgi:hypothetical protein